MKKFTLLALFAALLTSCSSQPETEEITSETTTAAVTTEQTTAPSTTVATTTAVTNPTLYNFSNFNIAYFCQESELSPMQFSRWGDFYLHELNEDSFSLALEALKSSDYYKTAVENGKLCFLYENGEYVINEEYTSFFTQVYPSFFDYDKSGSFELKPKLANTVNALFDGEHMEQLFVFELPLCCEMETSAYSTCYITVYVNYKGEAKVIPECTKQTLNSIESIRLTENYFDSINHVIFSYGHTSGTSGSTVISFHDGEYAIEYEGGQVDFESGDCFMLMDHCNFFRYCSLLVYDKEKGYCEVSGEPISEKAREILSHSAAITEAFPDFMNEDIYICGGKFIFVSGKGTFTFENGVFCPYKCVITPAAEGSVSYAVILE